MELHALTQATRSNALLIRHTVVQTQWQDLFFFFFLVISKSVSIKGEICAFLLHFLRSTSQDEEKKQTEKAVASPDKRLKLDDNTPVTRPTLVTALPGLSAYSSSDSSEPED